MEMNRDGEEGFSEMDLIQVKTPSGGGLFWTVKGATGTESLPFIEGVIVFRCLKGIFCNGRSDGRDADPVIG